VGAEAGHLLGSAGTPRARLTSGASTRRRWSRPRSPSTRSGGV